MAQCLQAFDQVCRQAPRLEFVRIILPEFAIVKAVSEHVVDDDQQRVPDATATMARFLPRPPARRRYCEDRYVFLLRLAAQAAKRWSVGKRLMTMPISASTFSSDAECSPVGAGFGATGAGTCLRQAGR